MCRLGRWLPPVDLGPFNFRPDGSFSGGVAWKKDEGVPVPVFCYPGRLPDGLQAERPEVDAEEWDRRARELHRDHD